jgi:hypothetical protein
MSDQSKKKNIMKYLFGFVIIILLGIISFFIYSYIQGSKENYKPPTEEKKTSDEQASNDLIALSNAIDSYYTINLSYPDSLNALIPDFLNKLPKEQFTNKIYIYNVLEDSAYEVKVKNPKLYKLTEFKVRNGKLIKY